MKTTINIITSYLMAGFAFLLPVFFLPNVIQPGLIGKQIFLAVFVFLFAGLWVAKALKSGQIKLFWSKGLFFVLALLLIISLANVFSLSPTQSFWGMNFEPDTTWSFILYSVLFFFCLQFAAENKKMIVGTIKGFLAGSLVLSCMFFLQHLAWKFWPWPLMKDIGFNPIGFPQAMVLFLAGALAFISAYLTFAGDILKKKKAILFACLAVFLAVLILANMPNVWLALGIALLVLVVCCVVLLSRAKQPAFGKKSWLALGLLVVAVFLLLSQWGSFVKLPAEVMLSQKASFGIAKDAAFSNVKNSLLGSGPATFIFDYDLFHSAAINTSQFWNLRFSQGAAFFPTLLACCGFLGLLAFLGLLVILIGRVLRAIGIKAIRNKKQKQLPCLPALGMAALIACVFYFVCWFFYQANSALMATGFMFLAFEESYWLKEKTWKWNRNVLPAVMAICLMIFVLLVAGFYKTAKSYLAAAVYAKAVQEYNSPAGIENAILGLEKAGKLDQKDVYFRTLTQVLNLKIKQISSKPGFDKTELQEAVSLAEKTGIKASQLDSRNSQNWLNLAIFYEGLSALQVQKAADSALDCLQKSKAQSPSNPQIPLMMAKLYISAVQQETVASAQKNSQFLQLAVECLKQSLALKSNFSSAYYLLAVAYEMQGQNDLAIQNYQEVLKIDPSHKEALQRLSVLTGQ
ncbi:MAG: tetratricopeptide repeat protein [Candidatus Pacebacteria bacterium]|nr:tetratricopeptide repeat protein [Candidatus Paceibacterota bacterium]